MTISASICTAACINVSLGMDELERKIEIAVKIVGMLEKEMTLSSENDFE